MYPASLDLRGRPVLVVGGGAVAARKVASLLGAQACVTVVAPEFDAAFRNLAKCATAGRARLRLVKRQFRVSDLNGHSMAFATTGDLGLNVRIAEQAQRRGLWVNVAAPGEAGNFQVPSALWRGPVCVAVSTSGASAALARTIRERLGQVLGPEWGQLAALLEARRERILKEVTAPGVRRGLLRRLSEPRWAKRIKRYGLRRAARDMDKLIGKIQNPKSKIQNLRDRGGENDT